jgi:FlaA1/EpsC-like NDP-sugar epimerase
MNSILNNKIFLITGGTGSFGEAMVKFLLKTKIKKIIIFSRDEKKQEEMRIKFNTNKLFFFLGDVRDYNSILNSMKNVDFVFHAAALKQVPSCEFFPLEAISTNVIGAHNVMKAAYENNISKCILLSTDKAVYPINAMGMTKALMEKIMMSNAMLYKNKKTIFCATRYGNVAGSRGSVIPHFINQIKLNKNLTVTDPNMTRFLMSLDDSVKLVMYALKNGKTGEIFIQKSSACRIIDLCEALKIIFKKKIINKYIGTRHGEKKHEVLISKEELIKAYESKNFYVIPTDSRHLNYAKYFSKGDTRVETINEYSSNSVKILSIKEIIKFLSKLEIIRHELKN